MLTQLIEKLSKCQNGNIQKPAKLFVYYEYIACILFVYCLYIVCILFVYYDSNLIAFYYVLYKRKTPRILTSWGFIFELS